VKNSPSSLSTVIASRPGKSRSQYRPFYPLPHTITPLENRGPYRPAVLQVEVPLFLPGFRKYSRNIVSSVGVDTVSCGTGKRDRRIGNPGPYRAYPGYGLPAGRVLHFPDPSRKSTDNQGPARPRITCFSHPDKSVSQKTKSVSGYGLSKTAHFTSVEPPGLTKRI